jgi:NADH:ubiquinone reductase (H+-translocating)
LASIEQAGSEEIRRELTFALVGAGTVGVEMAGTLAEMSRMALAHDFRRRHGFFYMRRGLESYPHILRIFQSKRSSTWRN